MKALDIMTRPVITVDPDRPVAEVAGLLLERNISGVPVVDKDDKVVGIISEGDLVRRHEIDTDQPRHSWWLRLLADTNAMAKDYLKTHGRKARDIMTTDVIAVGGETPVAEIARLMERHHIKRVPVVEGGKLMGIVSRANIVRRIAAANELPVMTSADDETIRRRIEAILHDQPWASAGATNVTVNDGVVEFWGLIETDAQRDASRVAAEGVAGVKKIVDHRQARPRIPIGGL